MGQKINVKQVRANAKKTREVVKEGEYRVIGKSVKLSSHAETNNDQFSVIYEIVEGPQKDKTVGGYIPLEGNDVKLDYILDSYGVPKVATLSYDDLSELVLTHVVTVQVVNSVSKYTGEDTAFVRSWRVPSGE